MGASEEGRVLRLKFFWPNLLCCSHPQKAVLLWQTGAGIIDPPHAVLIWTTVLYRIGSLVFWFSYLFWHQ